MSKKDLDKAKRNKNDEFYTSYEVIERELVYYTHHFNNKIIYLNTDNPEFSQFWKYFKNNFENFKIKKLISTYYEKEGNSYRTELEYINNKLRETKIKLKENGDFRSSECIEILKECDVIITNPPFSLFREYFSLLVKYNKQFLIIGNQNAITYKELFPFIKNGEIKIGYEKTGVVFDVPYNYVQQHDFNKIAPNKLIVKDACWFTNLTILNRDYYQFTKSYLEDKTYYPKYDNFDAINVDKSEDIPDRYYESIGVPISFLRKLNYNQFQIIGIGKSPFIFNLNRKIYQNPQMGTHDKGWIKETSINRCFTINYSNLEKEELVKRYLFKTKYKADNSDGLLIAPYARLLIKRIEK